MSHKKIDPRIEILSYINEKLETEYYPRCGFPFEVFIINENSNIELYTKENLNASNFIFFTPATVIADIAVSLKKMVFTGMYSLYDYFSYNYYMGQNDQVISSYDNITDLITISTYLSQSLDMKIINIFNCKTDRKVLSLSTVYTNAIWLERENSEMFKAQYQGLQDSRKLLLDYTTTRGVLLKNYGMVNYSEYYKNYSGVNYYHA